MTLSADHLDYSEALATIKAARRHLQSQQVVAAPTTCSKDQWPPNYAAVLAWREGIIARWEIDKELLASAKAFYKGHPVEFINHWCNTYDPRLLALGQSPKLPLILFPKQEELVEFVVACIKGEASGMIEKSRDMGATWVCVAISVWLWLFWDGPAIGWGSNNQDKVDKLGDLGSIFGKIRMLIMSLPVQLLPAGFDEKKHLFYMRCINPETEAVISGEIGDNIGRGGRTLVYFVDEAAHLERPEAVEASLSENTRVRIDISSVSGIGTVFWRKRQAGVDWVRGARTVPGRTNVLVMDWSDHPLKTKAWFTERKSYFEDNGLAPVFARETGRDYAGAVEGIVIPSAWVLSAIDAHLVIPGFDLTGAWWAGLDVADQGLDTNALAKRQGVILRHLEEWGARDTGATARRAVGACAGTLPIELQYDAIGVGTGVKSESNRLRDEGLLPKGIKLVPWVASAGVLDPFEYVIEGDAASPTNKNFYGNLKAQAWWSLRRRFELTHRCITEPGFTCNVNFLISIDSKLPLLRKLQTELSQPTMGRDTRTMKLIIDKQPEGMKSPNLADAVVMAYFPWHGPQEPLIGMFGPIIVRPK